MQINSSAAYASAISLSQGRSQMQVDQLKQSSEQSGQVTSLLAGGGSGGGSTKPAASGGRGQIVDITA